jgi:hypothetical protein
LDQHVKDRIQERRKAGASYEKIYKELPHRGYTKEDVSRLGNLGPRRPKN